MVTILVLGASGLLGNAVFRVLSEPQTSQVVGTIRDEAVKQLFIPSLQDKLMLVRDLEDLNQLILFFNKVRPSVVVNCTSLSKSAMQDPMRMFSLFSLLPKRLAQLCRQINARLIHISTDCVFAGTRGLYTENDITDTTDPYGVAKVLGEIDGPGVITLRTSMLGHELTTKHSLLEWFLSQNKQCKGYRRAIFTGFPTVVLAQIIRDIILPRPQLDGIFHLATAPITKFDLLCMVAEVYQKAIDVVPDDTMVIDRSLLAEKFKCATGYESAAWPTLINIMYSYKFGLKEKECLQIK